MTKGLKGITFDFDATLYNYLSMAIKKFYRYLPNIRLIYALTVARAELRYMGHIKDFRRRQAEVIARRWHKPVDLVEKRIQSVVYMGWNMDFKGIKPEKGVFDLLDMLVDNNIKISIVSDYPAEDKLEKMGFLRYPWVTIINCEDIGWLKPNPHGFKLAMKRMGTLPSETMHVGDSLKYDILGAKNAGMMTAWLKRWWKIGKIDIKPDYTISNFYDLIDILKRDFDLG